MIGARDLFTAPLAMTDQVRAYLRTIEVARRVVRDPGRYLLRFPFNLLPARWLLSDKAMDVITRALCTGISVGGTVPAKPPLLRVVLARNLQVGDLIDGKRPVREVHHKLDGDRYRVRVRTDVSEETCDPGRAFHVKRR
jgi:hypothetical protein